MDSTEKKLIQDIQETIKKIDKAFDETGIGEDIEQ